MVFDRRKPRILVGPYEGPDRGFIGLLVLTPQVWIASASLGMAGAGLASRMLALLVLQEEHPLLHAIRVPTNASPPMAFLLSGGRWTDLRQQRFPDEVYLEIERVASAIRDACPGFVQAFATALGGERPSGWESPSVVPSFAEAPDETFSVAPPLPHVSIDSDALGRWGTEEFMFHLMHIDYKNDRYMEALSEDELLQRAVDAVINAIDFDGPSRMITDVNNEDHLQAMAWLAEVIEELRIRRGDLPDDFVESLVRESGLQVSPAVTGRALRWIWSQRFRTIVGGLAKFGQEEHIRAAYHSGAVRLTPASHYDADLDLNRAQRGTELEVRHEIDVKRSTFNLLDENRKLLHANIQIHRATGSKRSPTDAYLFCGANRITARLFHDFGHACLIIHDRDEFVRRLADAAKSKLFGWSMESFRVTYFDGFEPLAESAVPIFFKEAKYRYQAEHRVAWFPPEPMFALQPLILEVGPLTDIAEIVCLSDFALVQ